MTTCPRQPNSRVPAQTQNPKFTVSRADKVGMTATELNLDRFTDHDLLRLWKRTTLELRTRRVCRSKNIVGDLAERIVATKLGLSLAPKVMKAIDATGPEGATYQIKARDLTGTNNSRQLGDLSGLHDGHPFDFLIAVFFGNDFPRVEVAYKIPLTVVRQYAKKKGKRDVLIAKGAVLTAPGVEDITMFLA